MSLRPAFGVSAMLCFAWLPVCAAGCEGGDATPATRSAASDLEAEHCEKLEKERGDLFPSCTNRTDATERIWPFAKDPVIDWPADEDAQRTLCRDTYDWYHLQDSRFADAKAKYPDLTEEVCFGSTPVNIREHRDGLKLHAVFCRSLYMSYAPLADGRPETENPNQPFDGTAKNAKGLFHHFSPCRNRLFVQCALNGKLAISRANVRWTIGPLDPVDGKDGGPPLDITFIGSNGDISFTTQEMCMFRKWDHDQFPIAKRFKDTYTPH